MSDRVRTRACGCGVVVAWNESGDDKRITCACGRMIDLKPVSGVEMIAIERERQIVHEGFVDEHDDIHVDHQLIVAACCYLREVDELDSIACVWPWDQMSWKPRDPISNLVRAGALVAAEIDRLARAGER